MLVHTFSPFAPARVRVLVLPMGRIKRSRFSAFHRLLMNASDVKLQDLCSEERPSTTVFSPESFPEGMILFDFNSSIPPASHSGLVPFELFREPMIIVGIGDAHEYPDWSSDSRKGEFSAMINDLRDKFTRTLIHRVFLFDEPGVNDQITSSYGVVQIPPSVTAEKLCADLALSFLDEVASYAKSILPLPSIASPTVPQGQTIQAQFMDDIPGFNKQSSHNGSSSRSSTPNADLKELHRMSMPSLSSSDSTPRNQSPGHSPARTFEEMNANTLNSRNENAHKPSKLRPGTISVSREGSQDRLSVHGFGSDSFNEKARNKGRGRVGVVLASVFMQAGRWHDALREAVESAHKSRAMNDHLWHAKALETVVLCMILLAWTGYEFPIPQICYPSIDKPPSSDDAATTVEIQTFSSPTSQVTLLKMLTNLIPSLTNTIMSIYARTSFGQPGDVVPQVVFSEFGIRMAQLMGAIHMAGGTLTTQCISHLVLGTPLPSNPLSDGTKPRIFPSRREITLLLTRALPPNDQSGLLPADRINILAGIVSVYSILGMHRKKALILKELLETLTPILRQIKVIGAAEAGFHPSSGMSSFTRLNRSGLDEERGLEELLNAVCHVYGVPESNWLRSIGMEALHTEQDSDSPQDHALPEVLIGNFVLRSIGNLDIKIEILRTCIQVCESLPDYHGILHYSSALLRTAGPGIAQSSDTGDVLVSLSGEEQLQLSSNILKTVADAKAAGFNDVDAEYWDEFLVRGLYVLDPPRAHVFLPHRKSEMQVSKADKGPFIHNPFAEIKKTEAWQNLLAVGEEREFVVSLQNPYDFEVAIQHIKLSAEDGPLDIASHDLVLKPYRTQSFSLVGSIPQDGCVSINGCIVKIKGCKERLFPIFSKPWAPLQETKVKSIGFVKGVGNERISNGSNFSSIRENSESSYPIPEPLNLTIIPPQPVLIIKTTSISHNALMLLEGERTTFSVTLQNTSSTVPANFLHISFFDSASAAMHDALGQKGLAAGDMYEIEYQLLRLQAVSAMPNQPTSIQPNSTETFHFHLLAKPGLTSVNVQFDYSNIAQPHLKEKDTIFTRQVILPISVTVNASIQIQRLEVVPLSSDFEWPPKQANDHVSPERPKSRFDSVFEPLQSSPKHEDYCILLFDVRNSWPAPLHCQIKATFDQDTKQSRLSQTSDLVNPGQSIRQMLIIPRMYITDPHAPIMPLSPGRQRQFVVSTEKFSADTERSLREMFWFRERLLSYLQGSWKMEGKSGARSGNIDLRTVRFNTKIVDVLRLPDISISYAVLGESVQRRGRSKFDVQVDAFATVRINLFNRSNKTISPLLRLRPSLSDQPREIALDLGKKFAWSGVLQQVLPNIAPRMTYTMDLPICALSTGEFEIGATVEEVKPAVEDLAAEKEAVLDYLMADTKRRTWTAEESCKIVAINADE